MNKIIYGLLGALLSAPALPAATNDNVQTNRAMVAATGTNSQVEAEFKKLEEMDDAAAAEVDKWIRDNQKFAAEGAGVPNDQLNQRIRARLAPIRKAYEEFIAQHPDHAGVRLAFASFLEDQNDEEAALLHLEKARELDPKNPAAWNNLANHYGHDGPVKKSFEYYAKAIELNPNEPVYYQNFATTVYLFRKDAMEFYSITEQQVFDKALGLYEKAFQLAPEDFNLATDLAQTYYGIKPTRTDDALKAWTNALAVAHDDVEREGVHVHFARFKWHAGRTNEARAHLNLVTNTLYGDLKRRLLRNLDAPAAPANSTNSPPAAVEQK